MGLIFQNTSAWKSHYQDREIHNISLNASCTYWTSAYLNFFFFTNFKHTSFTKEKLWEITGQKYTKNVLCVVLCQLFICKMKMKFLFQSQSQISDEEHSWTKLLGVP